MQRLVYILVLVFFRVLLKTENRSDRGCKKQFLEQQTPIMFKKADMHLKTRVVRSALQREKIKQKTRVMQETKKKEHTFEEG